MTSNTILYCRKWEETVRYYRDRLRLPVTFSTDWFVEFRLTEGARLSIADEARSSIPSACGKGITVALEVDRIEAMHDDVTDAGLAPSRIRQHPWNARVFYLVDPEGHRIEIWQAA